MKRFLTSAVVSLAIYGVAASHASAGWLNHCQCQCTEKYKVTVTCRQYNAFSPFCCETSVCKSHCLFGHGHCNHGACNHDCPGTQASAPGCDSGLGELPAADPKVASMAYQQGVQGTPVSLPNLMPQAPSWQAWGPSMINPNGPSSNYPMNPGYVSGGYDGR